MRHAKGQVLVQFSHFTKGWHQHDVVSQLVGGVGTISHSEGDGASVVTIAAVETALAATRPVMEKRRASTERIVMVGR